MSDVLKICCLFIRLKYKRYISFLYFVACHLTHFCKTTNDTFLAEYRQFVQGVGSSFFISTLQGLTKDISYVTVKNLIPLELLELKSDINCI